MAVQQGKMTRAKRNQRRSHDRVIKPTLSIEQETGETHRRHHISADGYYRGKQVITNPLVDADDE